MRRSPLRIQKKELVGPQVLNLSLIHILFVDQLGDRVLVSTRDCPIPTDFERELRELGMPVFHKKLEQNQKEAPVQICLLYTSRCV